MGPPESLHMGVAKQRCRGLKEGNGSQWLLEEEGSLMLNPLHVLASCLTSDSPQLCGCD